MSSLKTEEVRHSCSILEKLLKSKGTGAWRSVARIYLAQFYAEQNNAKKLESLFESVDPADPLFVNSKKKFLTK